MIETKVTIRRGASQTNPSGGTVIWKDVDIQIQQRNPMLLSEKEQEHAFDMYDGLIKYLPSAVVLLRSDAFLDQWNTDPLTGLATFYQVVARPQPFPDEHVECVLRLYEGAA